MIARFVLQPTARRDDLERPARRTPLILPSAPFFAACCAWACALCAASVPAAAQSTSSGVLACRGITDDTARLACFDRESARLAASPTSASTKTLPAAQTGSHATADASAPAPPAASTPSLDPQQTFGLSTAQISDREVAAGARPREAVSITAHVARIAQGSNGRFIFTLDNQQVWQELLAAGDLDSKSGDSVVISRGMLGSYWMKAQSGRGCKVTRLR